MSFIKLPAPEETAPALRPAPQTIQREFGFLPNYFRAVGCEPSTGVEQLALGDQETRQGGLSPVLKEQIGMVRGGINSSSYRVAAHTEVLRDLGVEKSLRGSRRRTTWALRWARRKQSSSSWPTSSPAIRRD